MILIRSKKKVMYRQTSVFALSDILLIIFITPFAAVLTILQILFHKLILVLIAAVPTVVITLIVTKGDIGLIWSQGLLIGKLLVSILAILYATYYIVSRVRRMLRGVVNSNRRS